MQIESLEQYLDPAGIREQNLLKRFESEGQAFKDVRIPLFDISLLVLVSTPHSTPSHEQISCAPLHSPCESTLEISTNQQTQIDPMCPLLAFVSLATVFTTQEVLRLLWCFFSSLVSLFPPLHPF